MGYLKTMLHFVILFIFNFFLWAIYSVLKLVTLVKFRTKKLKDPKVVVITGASSGIGEAFAVYYSKPGSVIAITARRKDKLEEVARKCEALGAKVVQGQLDVTDKEGMKKWLCELDDEHPVDLVIANAGVTASTLGLEGKLEEAAYQVYNTNIYGTFNTIFPLIPRMKKRQYGQIAIMSSVSALGPVKGMFEYCSSKSALKLFSESLRWLLYRDGIHVNALVPGFFDSPLTEVNKGAMPFKQSLSATVHALTEGIRHDTPVVHSYGMGSILSWLLFQVVPDDFRDVIAKSGVARLVSYHSARKQGKEGKEGKHE